MVVTLGHSPTKITEAELAIFQIESWICKSCFDRYIDSGGSRGEAWGARAPLFLETN